MMKIKVHPAYTVKEEKEILLCDEDITQMIAMYLESKGVDTKGKEIHYDETMSYYDYGKRYMKVVLV